MAVDDAMGAGEREPAVATAFEAHRRLLTGLAYRMLGTLAEAEDVVQDAWLRLARADADAIDDLGAWLTTVVSRLCLDRFRAARAVRETYVGPWLPEPVVTDPRVAPDPAAVIEVDDSVRLALLVVLERLTPEQRVAFVLHDVFGVPFEDVARTLGTTPAAARQLASRGRRAARAAGSGEAVPPDRQARTLEAFRRATLAGDLEGLVAVLAPDVTWRSDGGGLVPAALRPVVGAEKVARLLLGLAQQVGPGAEVRDVLVNGEPGVLVVAEVPASRGPRTVLLPHLGVDGRVHAIDVVRSPEKLRRVT